MTQVSLRRKGFISCNLSSRDVETGALGNSLGQEQKSLRNVVYWLVPYSMLILLPYTTQDHLRRGSITHNELDIHHQSLKKSKSPHRLFYNQILGRHFSWFKIHPSRWLCVKLTNLASIIRIIASLYLIFYMYTHQDYVYIHMHIFIYTYIIFIPAILTYKGIKIKNLKLVFKKES